VIMSPLRVVHLEVAEIGWSMPAVHSCEHFQGSDFPARVVPDNVDWTAISISDEERIEHKDAMAQPYAEKILTTISCGPDTLSFLFVSMSGLYHNGRLVDRTDSTSTAATYSPSAVLEVRGQVADLLRGLCLDVYRPRARDQCGVVHSDRGVQMLRQWRLYRFAQLYGVCTIVACDQLGSHTTRWMLAEAKLEQCLWNSGRRVALR
jgi:hypothetical protein